MSYLSYCRSTVGVFFLNAAEGWIDINKGETGIMESLSNKTLFFIHKHV